jgi:hypothetical protein
VTINVYQRIYFLGIAMPFIGLGLHILVALYFAVHAVRTGQQMYWLIILFSFPLLGSVVYFAAIYLPASRMERGVRKVANVAANAVTSVLDPGRELREAKQAFDLAPTAQNQMRVASAHLEDGNAGEAAKQFDLCLQGPFATDATIRVAAARAKLQNNQAAEAAQLLARVKAEAPQFRAEQVCLLLAQSLAASEKNVEAKQEFMEAVARFDSADARGEYAIWAAGQGDLDTANSLRAELEKAQLHWSKHTRSLHQPLMRRVDAAISGARK